MFTFTDQLGRTINLKNYPPKRVISLVPSQTELLYNLGLDKEVIGITKFCVHPESWFNNKERVGGTKNINSKKIQALKPDLIIANKEENVKEQIEELEKIAPVWISDVNNFEDALNMIERVAALVNREEQANEIIEKIKDSFYQLPVTNCQLPTCYLIWRNPYMVTGGDTFIGDMLRKCGFQNIFDNEKRYPAIILSQLSTANCSLVLLSSEPYPFKHKHIAEIQSHLPHCKCLLVNGEMFSWYGSRMINAAGYFKNLIKAVNNLL